MEFIQLALETKPLNLGQGFPDDLVPDYIPKTLADVAQESILLNQYTRGFVSRKHNLSGQSFYLPKSYSTN